MEHVKEKRENLVEAFVERGRCRGTCACGRVFYNAHDDTIDWELDEWEELEKTGTGLPYSIGVFSLQGKDYIEDCDCWHEHARQFMQLIDDHAYGIVSYLREEKARKQRLADDSPVLEEV